MFVMVMVMVVVHCIILLQWWSDAGEEHHTATVLRNGSGQHRPHGTDGQGKPTRAVAQHGLPGGQNGQQGGRRLLAERRQLLQAVHQDDPVDVALVLDQPVDVLVLERDSLAFDNDFRIGFNEVLGVIRTGTGGIEI